MTAALTTDSTLLADPTTLDPSASPISTAMPLHDSVGTNSDTLHPLARLWDSIRSMIQDHIEDEKGMSTIEYALGCVAAAALGALLYTVVTSGAVEDALSGIFERALNEGQ